MKKYCFALDLIDDPDLIELYREHHKNVWPEIEDSIQAAGIESLEIYLVANRLFMIMETLDSFSLKEKSISDQNNAKVQAWENLMWTYQKALPTASQGEKWIQMDLIYKLNHKKNNL